MTDSVQPYNPLDKIHLAESIEAALKAQPIHPVPPVARFGGAGIYGIYYAGPFEPYAPISSPDCLTPIYVGSALPEGGRTGGVGLTTQTTTTKLYQRLRDHTRSIEQAQNLDLSHFLCRYLLLDDVWIPLAENYLIGLNRPLWNSRILEGFGIHAPGRGRRAQRRSLWDELHPGRVHAAKRPPAVQSREEILERIERFFAGDESALA